MDVTCPGPLFPETVIAKKKAGKAKKALPARKAPNTGKVEMGAYMSNKGSPESESEQGRSPWRD